MRAQDRQPNPTPVAGTQVKPPGTDESTGRSDVPPKTDGAMARAGEQSGPKGPTARTKASRGGRLQSIKRGLSSFAAGFQGATWDQKADEAIRKDLRAFGKMSSLSDVDKQRLKPRIKALLQTQKPFLRSEAAVEAIANRVTWVLGFCVVVVPGVVVVLATGTAWIYLGFLIALTYIAAWPAGVLENLTGRDGAGLIWTTFVLSAYIAVGAWSVTGPDSREGGDTVAVALLCAATALTILLVLILARLYIVAWNKTALTRIWVEQFLAAAVVSKLLSAVQVLECSLEKPGRGCPKPLQPLVLSGTARALLTEAAEAVNDYLPRLIDARRAYSANAQSIASEGAAALLGLRSAVNLPGGRVRKEDLARLTATVEAWSIGSLADLPRKKVSPAADSLESYSRGSGLLQVVRKILLGTLPLILLIAITLLPVTMPAAVTDALAPFAVTWLLLSIASIFAPTDVKLDIKTLLGR